MVQQIFFFYILEYVKETTIMARQITLLSALTAVVVVMTMMSLPSSTVTGSKWLLGVTGNKLLGVTGSKFFAMLFKCRRSM